MKKFVANGRGWQVVMVDGKVPIVFEAPDGKVPIQKTFRGKTSMAKVPGGRMVFSPLGYRLDQLISCVQKTGVRRAILRESYFSAKEVWDMQGPFRTHLLRRLMKASHEDIGCANNELPIFVDQCIRDIENSNQTNERRVFDLLKALIISQKSRDVDCILQQYESPKSYPTGVHEYKVHELKKGENLWDDQKPGDHPMLVKLMNDFIDALRKNLELDACHIAMKIFFEVPRPGKVKRDSSTANNKDPIYAVWEYLINQAPGIVPNEVLTASRSLYDRCRNRRSELLFLIRSVIYVCRKLHLEACSPLEYQQKCKQYYVSDQEWADIQMHTKVVLPNYIKDCHTVGGVKSKDYFWDVGSILNDKKRSIYFQRARALSIQRQKEKMKPLRRRKMKPVSKKKRKSTIRSTFRNFKRKKSKLKIVLTKHQAGKKRKRGIIFNFVEENVTGQPESKKRKIV